MEKYFIEKTTPYSENLLTELENENVKDFLRKKMHNEEVLDLGCGDATALSYYFKGLRISKYIGVDLSPHHFIGRIGSRSSEEVADLLAKIANLEDDHDVDETSLKEEKITEYEDGSIVLIKGDILDEIKKMKDLSIKAVVLSGIEFSKYRDEKSEGEYLEKIKSDISRILKDGGIVLVYFSDFYFSAENFVKSEISNPAHNFYVYEKK
ncbi:MAG TPA: hypothetical protein PKA60_02435 [Candidatus Paceibacterota bacterium]|nr:hypothetical protein [Candidatus Paceibacterota bacterium]